MAHQEPNKFQPDYAVHPGEILEETLAARKMKKSELAERCGLTQKHVSQIINGKAPVTPETAIQLERALGVSAALWNNLDATYRLHAAQLADREQLERQKAWAKAFPVAALVKRGWLTSHTDPTEKVRSLLDFFGVGSVVAWQTRYQRIAVKYRRSPAFSSSFESVAAWLRIGELLAADIESAPYDKRKFEAVLDEIVTLTHAEPEVFESQMVDLCRHAGVAVVFASELPKTHLSGATRWVRSDKALIMLSLRHKTDDHLWFTFFHEAGHIVLHGRKSVFIDEGKARTNSKEEEADRFARKALIPDSEYQAFIEAGSFYEADIRGFAREIGIAPGIVVGRLQHDRHIPFSWHHDLKRKLVLVESWLDALNRSLADVPMALGTA